MKRRSFLKAGSLAGLLFGWLPFPRTRAGAVATPPGEFALNELSIKDLQTRMERGELSSRAITRLYLDRIGAIDKAGPHLNSVIELNPDALQVAENLDAERAQGRVRGPLHGIPIMIKDNIDSADGMQTTAGSIALAGNIAAKDAFIVARLREAGAVLLGKTNLSEWANMRSSKSSSGWSSRGGQTRNPYYLDRNPSGSSSGSGAAVSANLCAAAIGTETDGSITSPASSNCIVGIKPTVGLLSRSGIIPISSTQDTPGPMTRTVADAALLLGAMTGIDEGDTVTKESSGRSFTDYARFLNPDGLQGKRIGIDKKLQSENRYINALFQEALELMKARGAVIIETEYVNAINELGEAEFTVLQFEFRETLNRYLAGTTGEVRTLTDVIRFNNEHGDMAMPYFGQDVLESSDTKGSLDSQEYLDALKKSHLGSREMIDKIMKTDRLDVLCGITAGPPCSIDVIYGDRWGNVSSTTPAAISGYPHISVPCGMVHGLPVGISFFGQPYSEPLLIGVAYAYEQNSRKRIIPRLQERYEGF